MKLTVKQLRKLIKEELGKPMKATKLSAEQFKAQFPGPYAETEEFIQDQYDQDVEEYGEEASEELRSRYFDAGSFGVVGDFVWSEWERPEDYGNAGADAFTFWHKSGVSIDKEDLPDGVMDAVFAVYQ